MRGRFMKQTKLKKLTLIAIFAAIMCVCAVISLPLVVPITLQTLFLCLSVGLLGTKRAVAVVLVYIFMGLLGLPVFAGLQGGVGALFSNTGGYIIGFLPFVFIKGLTQKLFKNRFFSAFVSSILGFIGLYIIGSIWFCIVYYKEITFTLYISSLVFSVLPFILPDILKALISAIIEKRLKNKF